MSHTNAAPPADVRWASGRRIGPVGTTYRVLLVVFLLERLFHAEEPPKWWHYPLGLIVFPAVLVAAQAAYARTSPRPSSWIGPFGVAAIGTAVIVGFVMPVTRPAIGLMIVLLLVLSAIKGDPDCEGTVLGNWVLRRADRIACPNSIIDAAERQWRRRNFTVSTMGPDASPADRDRS